MENWRLECKGDNAKARYATISMSRVGAMRLKSLAEIQGLGKVLRFKIAVDPLIPATTHLL